MSTTLPTLSPADARAKQLREQFCDLTDAQRISAFNRLVGFLAGTIAYGYDVPSEKFATEALEMAKP